MNYWLIKSEPSAWSWEQMLKAGITHWNGVRNHQAANNLKAMRKGDRAFFYHSNEGKEIIGIVEIARVAYPDPADATGKFVMVDVKAVEALKKPVALAVIKTTPELQDMALLRLSRLSVQSVTTKEWQTVLKMAK